MPVVVMPVVVVSVVVMSVVVVSVVGASVDPTKSVVSAGAGISVTGIAELGETMDVSVGAATTTS
jgi:hypothetical protein